MNSHSAWKLAACAATLASVAGCSSATVQAQQSATPTSSAELAASCQALAASDRASLPKLSYATAKGQAGNAVPLCVVPKRGSSDGVARLEGSTAEMTKTPEWAEAISFDRPLPSGVAVSLSWDLYAFVDGAWQLARMTGTGSA